MRGSHYATLNIRLLYGIIPAHAGLTRVFSASYQIPRDHPRACGAHKLSSAFPMFASGSSPRMRGSPRRVAVLRRLDGIIPAHAGLTVPARSCCPPPRDHPRACGAHSAYVHLLRGNQGSSPRMRGSREVRGVTIGISGIIPAHAGLTQEI